MKISLDRINIAEGLFATEAKYVPGNPIVLVVADDGHGGSVTSRFDLQKAMFLDKLNRPVSSNLGRLTNALMKSTMGSPE